MVPFKFIFAKELEEVHRILDREITFKAANFDELIKLQLDELDKNVCAAIVLAVSEACGALGRQSIALATIVQYIFLADQVHRLMKDEGIDDEERQFPVLVGDFLYGKFFLGLCQEKLLNFLGPLARVIGVMNQGAISRWMAWETLDTREQLKILEMERASLTGIAARLGAELAGCSTAKQDKFEALGRQLGLAWAAWRERMEKHVVETAMQRAGEILHEFPNRSFQSLHDLYDYMACNLA